MVRLAPARTRFTLSSMKAWGLARCSAIMSWYSEMPATAWRRAMANMVSPGRTVMVGATADPAGCDNPAEDPPSTVGGDAATGDRITAGSRSEEHTSELQSRGHLV